MSTQGIACTSTSVVHITPKHSASIAEATAEATDHLWEIAPLNRAIPEFLKPGKIYFANKLPLNTQGE